MNGTTQSPVSAVMDWLTAYALCFALKATLDEAGMAEAEEKDKAWRLGISVEQLRFRARFLEYKRRGLTVYQMKKEERALRQSERTEAARALMASPPNRILGGGR